MDIKIKSEPFEIESDIKEEKELIIENDWIPTKYEENEYYQEFLEECDQNAFHETVANNEMFTKQYISEDNGDSDGGDYAESDDTIAKNVSDGEDLVERETLDAVGREDSSEAKVSYPFSGFVEELKTSRFIKNQKCPLCFKTFVRRIHLRYHFMDEHPHEYKAKLGYNCHKCKHKAFNDEEVFLQHLMEKHGLNSWKILNFFKVFEDKEYFACKKCNNLFFRHDSRDLLSHFLKHESNFCWSCKFCCRKITFQSSHISHMCRQMLEYYEKQNNEINVKRILKNPGEIKNLQEFEEHFAHVCPFCNKEFDRMLNWQHHLRTEHEIDTLKGLQMKAYVKDRNKLSCIICDTVVANSPEQLHTHRFQHLPYKPYKCLSCSKTLNSFKMSVNHVLNNCEDKGSEILSNLKMQCSICNCQKISDLKHFEDKHNNFQEFFIKNTQNAITCKICNKKFLQKKKNSCFLHLHQHFDEKTFKCKLCQKSDLYLEKISLHLLQVHNAKPLNELSNEENTDKTSFFLHKEDKLVGLGKSTKSHVLNVFSEFISYSCPECNESMESQQMWHTHVMTQHNFFDESNLYIKDADGSHKCPTCKITINSSMTHKQNHKLTHMPYRSFICNICYVRSSTLAVLYCHFRRKHFTLGTFQCYICTEIFQTEYKRTVHLKEKHSRDVWPKNLCTICCKIFSTKHSLPQHISTHDADRIRRTCDVCGIKFITLRDFNAHMDRHKMKGEIKEKVGDEFTLQCYSKNSRSTDIAAPGCNAKGDAETKSLGKSSAKRKRNCYTIK